MRVLAITSLYPNPFQPNLASFNRQQFRALAALHTLKVIAPIPWTVELKGRLSGNRGLPAGRRLERDGLAVQHPRYFFPPKIWRRSYGGCFRRSIEKVFQRAVAEFQPDVVLAAWAYPDAWAAAQLADRAALPLVIKVHGSDLLTLQSGSMRWQRTAEALRQAQCVVAVSADLAEKALAFGVTPEKIRLVYNGVDAEMFTPGPMPEARSELNLPQNMPVILYVGNLYPVKGVEILIKACSELRRSGLDFVCSIVGAGPLRAALEKQIAELRLQAQVRLMGARPHRELPVWFRAAGVLVLPSFSEGVPNVLLEAAACGTPFVASKVGGVPEVAHLGTGWLVPPGDAGALAEGIRQSLAASQPRARQTMVSLRSHADAARELADALQQACVANRDRPKQMPVPR